jgi:hypothetical protein
MSCTDPWACAYPCDGSHVHSPFQHGWAPSDTMGLDSRNGPSRDALTSQPGPRPADHDSED